MTLFVVATPIGNLEDITLRAVRVLKEVDVVAAENVLQTKKLLNKYEITTPLTRLHQHSRSDQLQKLVGRLERGEMVAYVSDAGTPGISDPGGQLVELASQAGIAVIPIPGPSAVTALLSVAGIPTDSFTFIGFLPKKKGRHSLWQELAELETPIVIFESPHRITKTLGEIKTNLGNRKIIIGRELTKLYEEILRSSVDEAIDHFATHAPRGEFVIIIQPNYN